MLQMVIQYKILVFAMLFVKDNIITMLTPENDSLLAYNAHAELPHAVVEQRWRSACSQIDSALRGPPFIILLYLYSNMCNPLWSAQLCRSWQYNTHTQATVDKQNIGSYLLGPCGPILVMICHCKKSANILNRISNPI